MSIEHIERLLVNKDEPTKKVKNSRQKGARAERIAAKVLSEWAGMELNRTPNSGGLRWQANQSIVGDIVAPSNSDFPFVVEIKHYSNFDLSISDKNRTLRKNSKLVTFGNQVFEDYLRLGNYSKIPVVMAKKNNMKKNEFFILFFDEWLLQLKNKFDLPCVAFWQKGEAKINTKFSMFGVFLFSNFLTVNYKELVRHYADNTPESIRTYYQQS